MGKLERTFERSRQRRENSKIDTVIRKKRAREKLQRTVTPAAPKHNSSKTSEDKPDLSRHRRRVAFAVGAIIASVGLGTTLAIPEIRNLYLNRGRGNGNAAQTSTVNSNNIPTDPAGPEIECTNENPCIIRMPDKSVPSLIIDDEPDVFHVLKASIHEITDGK